MEAVGWAGYVGAESSFPGYRSALPDMGTPGGLIDPYLVNEEPTDPEKLAFTSFHHIVDFEFTEEQLRATVCGYAIDVPENASAGPKALGNAWRIGLRNTVDNAGATGQPDDDPAYDEPAHRIPDWNVFGTWEIDELRRVPGTEIPDVCATWWKERFPTFVRRDGLNFFDAPEGYVPETMPVAPQYPEWIGPSTP